MDQVSPEADEMHFPLYTKKDNTEDVQGMLAPGRKPQSRCL